MTCLEKYRKMYPADSERSDTEIIGLECPSWYGIRSEHLIGETFDRCDGECGQCWRAAVSTKELVYIECRCKDCAFFKSYTEDSSVDGHCYLTSLDTHNDGFCSNAVRNQKDD